MLSFLKISINVDTLTTKYEPHIELPQKSNINGQMLENTQVDKC